jgi:hypothetical protein
MHVLSSVLFPYLLHPSVELRSCPHTQTHTLYVVKRSVFSRTLYGGWSRHNDRACEGRNGASKLVSDWELWTTYPTNFYPYGFCSFSHDECIHMLKFLLISLT